MYMFLCKNLQLADSEQKCLCLFRAFTCLSIEFYLLSFIVNSKWFTESSYVTNKHHEKILLLFTTRKGGIFYCDYEPQLLKPIIQ